MNSVGNFRQAPLTSILLWILVSLCSNDTWGNCTTTNEDNGVLYNFFSVATPYFGGAAVIVLLAGCIWSCYLYCRKAPPTDFSPVPREEC